MPKKTKSLEAYFEELETIVTTIEEGNVGLEESIQKFQEGLAVAKTIKTRLAQVESQVAHLSEETAIFDPEV